MEIIKDCRCGGELVLVRDNIQGESVRAIVCLDCRASGPTTLSVETAIESWNNFVSTPDVTELKDEITRLKSIEDKYNTLLLEVEPYPGVPQFEATRAILRGAKETALSRGGK